MAHIKRIDLTRDVKAHEDAYREAIEKVCRETAFSGGKYADAFDKEFAAYMDRYLAAKANQQPHPYAADAWKAMQDAGITDGTKPQCALTREQFATMCQRMGLIGKGVK